jgi:hypothetical protein
MKMLLIIFRESLEEEILGLLNEHNIRAFTELHKVGGVGETGAAFHAYTLSGVNTIIFTALAEDHADRVLEGLTAFRDQRVQEQYGAKVPLHVFVLPCLQAV